MPCVLPARERMLRERGEVEREVEVGGDKVGELGE